MGMSAGCPVPSEWLGVRHQLRRGSEREDCFRFGCNGESRGRSTRRLPTPAKERITFKFHFYLLGGKF